MPNSKSWFNFIYVNIGFASFIFGIFFFTSMKQIQDNWPMYRCNPLYAPFSKNLEEDFNYCVQNMAKSNMGNLLQPITFVTSSLSSLGSGLSNDINSMRNVINQVRSFFANIIKQVFGVFINVIIQFEVITLSIRDMLGKLIAIITSLLYILDGTMQTMESLWAGPPGKILKDLGKVAKHL
jgi:hypothetical protein